MICIRLTTSSIDSNTDAIITRVNPYILNPFRIFVLVISQLLPIIGLLLTLTTTSFMVKFAYVEFYPRLIDLGHSTLIALERLTITSSLHPLAISSPLDSSIALEPFAFLCHTSRLMINDCRPRCLDISQLIIPWKHSSIYMNLEPLNCQAGHTSSKVAPTLPQSISSFLDVPCHPFLISMDL